VITWTPSEVQAPSTNQIITVVSDGLASATNSFTVIVTALTNEILFEITSIQITNGIATVTWNSVTGRTYRLLHKDDLLAADWSAVPFDVTAAGASVSHTNLIGEVAQRFYRVQLITNTAPTLPVISEQTVAELSPLSVTNTAADANLPAELLTYALIGAPTNAVISAAGVITWTPGEDQGPSTNLFTTVVTDNGGLSATNSFTVVVTEVNDVPVFVASPTNMTVVPMTVVVVTNSATDSDLPVQTLSYSLLNAPAGVAVTTNGVITWTPSEVQAPSTNQIITVVSDGLASATNSFTVIVTVPTNVVLFEITSIQITNGVATLTWNSVSNLSYVLQYNGDLTSTNWVDVPPAVVAVGTNAWTTNVLNGAPQRFYRVRQGTVAPLALPAPVIQSLVSQGGNAIVTWTSVSNATYTLQYKTSLEQTNWISVAPSILANGSSTSQTNGVGADPQRFYRVRATW